MRVPSAIIDEMDALSKQYGVDRKMLLSAALVIMRCIMEGGAGKIDIICSDGNTKNIPVPLIFDKGCQQ